MRKFLLSAILTSFIALATFTGASAEFFRDIIITSPNGLWTDSRAYSTLNDAINAVGSNERTIKIVSPQAVTSLTIPSNITLKFTRNGSITNSEQLILETDNIIAPNRQIFTGTGDIDFAAGSVVKSSWFANLDTALDLTNDDTLTLIITKSESTTASMAVGDNVTLRWNSPFIITSLTGHTVSNIKNIEAGNYQLFAGAGDFDFLDGAELKLNWFASLMQATTWVEAEEVTILINEESNIVSDLTTTSNENIKIIPGGSINISAEITLTLGSILNAGDYQIFTGTGEVNFASGSEIKSAWFSNFETAITKIGTDEVKLIVSSASSIVNDCTINVNTSLSIPSKGRILTIASTKTLTINGSFEAGLYQVFSGDGAIDMGEFSSPISASWFSSINKAVNSGAHHIVLAPNTVYVEDNTNMFYSTTGFWLEGNLSSTIKINNARNNSVFSTQGSSTYIRITNVRVDGNRTNSSYGTKTFHFASSHTVEEIIITGCVLTSGYFNIHINSVVEKAIISGNLITDIAPHDGSTKGNFGAGIATTSANIQKLIISDNIISGPSTILTNEGPEGIMIYDGVYAVDAESEVIIANNVVSYCGGDAAGNLYSSIDLYHGTAGAIIEGNKVNHYTYQGMRVLGGIDSEIVITDNVIESPLPGAKTGLVSAGVSAIISNNVIADAVTSGLNISPSDSNPDFAKNVIVSNNVISSNSSAIYTKYTENLVISNNIINSPVEGHILSIIDSSTSGGEGTVSIVGNTIIGDISSTTANGIRISGSCGTALISSNTIKDIGESSIYVISVIESCIITNNTLETAAYGVRTGKEFPIFVANNSIKNITHPYHAYVFEISSNGKALNVFGHNNLHSTSNACNSTLGDGDYVGQTKTIGMTDASNSSTVTVAHHETSNPEVFTFNTVGAYLKLEWTGYCWVTIFNKGVGV